MSSTSINRNLICRQRKLKLEVLGLFPERLIYISLINLNVGQFIPFIYETPEPLSRTQISLRNL
jgi:hypothetical protein